MGNTESKTTFEQLTEVAATATQSTAQSCTTTASASQLVRLPSVKNSIKFGSTTITQGVAVNIQCLMQTDKQLDIINKVSAALAQEVQAKAPALLPSFGNTVAEASATIKNKFSTTFTQSDVQQMTTRLSADQTVVGGDIEGSLVIGDLTIEQGAHATLKAMMSSGMYGAVITDIATKIDQQTKATTTDPIADLAKNIGMSVALTWFLIVGLPIILFIVVFGIIVGVIVYKKKKSRVGGYSDDQSDFGLDSFIE